MDHDQKILLVILMYLCVKRGLKRVCDNDSEMTEHKYTLELMQRNPLHCVEVLHMSRESFVRLFANF